MTVLIIVGIALLSVFIPAIWLTTRKQRAASSRPGGDGGGTAYSFDNGGDCGSDGGGCGGD